MIELIENSTGEEHFSASPSGAKQWMLCPAKVSRESTLPEQQNNAVAAKGTLIHHLCEQYVKGELDEWELPVPGEKARYVRDGAEYEFEVDDDLIYQVTEYKKHIDDIREKHSDLIEFVEIKLDLQHLYAGMFGSADYVAYSRADNALYVTDLKTGAVRVSAYKNPQMLIYASGAIEHLRREKIITRRQFKKMKVTLTIWQNNKNSGDNINSYETGVSEVLEHDEKVKLALGDVFSDDPTCRPSEEACKYCKAASHCAELREHIESQMRDIEENISVAEVEDKTKGDYEMIGEIIAKYDAIKSLIDKLRESLLEALESGEQIPGWKIVESAPRKKFVSEDAVIEKLTALGLDPDDFFNKRLMTPKQLIEAISVEADEATLKEIEALIVTPEPKRILAAASDRRKGVEPIGAALSAMD